MVAQAILEADLQDGSQPSVLAWKYNNLNGIKGSGTAGKVYLWTTEYIKGQAEKVQAWFAANKSVEDSLQQKKNLFEHGTSDNSTRYFKVLAAPTFEDAAVEVRKAGYATNPQYTQELIDIYNRYIKNNQR